MSTVVPGGVKPLPQSMAGGRIPTGVQQQPQAQPVKLTAVETPIYSPGAKNDPSNDVNKAKTSEELAKNPVTGVAPLSSDTFDGPSCIERITQVRDKALTYSGKPGCNPHLWLKENVQPLIERLERGETSKELFELVMALRCPDKPTSREKGVKILPRGAGR